MTTTDEARDRAAHAATVKAIRHNIGTVTMDLGRAAGKLTTDPVTALVAFDNAIELLKVSRDLFAAAAGLEAAGAEGPDGEVAG